MSAPVAVRTPRQRMATPRLLRLLRFGIVLSMLLAAAASAWALNHGATDMATIARGTDQVQRLQVIRGNILRADGLATNGLAQASEPAAQRESYRALLDEAARLTVVASDAQPLDQAGLAEANAGLVRYAATIELARTVYPTNATSALARVDEAQATLRDQVLPALDRLDADNQGRVDAARSTGRSGWPFVATVPIAIALFALVLVAMRTRRLVNIGLALALVAGLGLWQVTDSALGRATTAVDAAHSGPFRTAMATSHAYAAASDAKSSEGRLTLQTSAAAAGNARWRERVARARSALAEGAGPADLSAKLDAYEAAYGVLQRASAAKRSGDVARLAGDASAAGVNPTFAAFSDASRAVADAAGAETARTMSERQDALGLGVAFAVLLGLAGAIAGAMGVNLRLEEYR